MLATMLRTWVIELRRDRVALMMTFLLPIAFFSVFGVIFKGAGSGSATDPVKVLVADEDRSEASRRMIEALGRDGGLAVRTTDKKDGGATLDRGSARNLVAKGEAPVALVIPKGFGATFGTFGPDGPRIELLADTSDRVAPQMVAGMLQGAAMTAAPDLMAERGLAEFEKYAGAMTPEQRKAMDQWMPKLREWTASSKNGKEPNGDADEPSSKDSGGSSGKDAGGFSGPVSVKMVDVLGEQKTPAGALVANSAAQAAVMFLLFMASGAAGSLLEEQENGVLERLLGTRLTMGRLLGYKWVFLVCLGVLQVSVMFLWGWGMPFLGLELFKHTGGFLVMTVATAAAGSALGLVLATACKTRAQLGGISTVVILTMSAVGGSMVPRMFMPPFMQKVGWVTFNAWAMEGYTKVFWREAGVAELWPEVGVLVGATVVFLMVARVLARRWEAA